MPTMVIDEQFVAPAIAQTTASPDLLALLESGSEQAAGAAIICGRDGYTDAIQPLCALLGEDSLAGRAAAWALGKLGAKEALLAVSNGNLDEREHAYLGLAVIAANHPPADLAEPMVACVQQELERAQAGRSGLAEQPCRVLAILGDQRVDDLIKEVTDKDPLTDRYELQRQRKMISEYGHDEESRKLFAGDWRQYFADDCYHEAPTNQPPPSASDELDPSPASQTQTAPNPTQPDIPEAAAANAEREDDEAADSDAAAEPEVEPLDVDSYLTHAKAAGTIDEQTEGLIKQVVPMLEQLAQQAVGVPLGKLGPQEFALLMLQVLPQALPQQYIQALLSPQALNALGRFFRWLEQDSSNGNLRQGLALVRQQLQEQVRASGMLGGPDFSDPDESDEQSAQ